MNCRGENDPSACADHLKAAGTDVVVVVATGESEGEQHDRAALGLRPDQLELIQATRAALPNASIILVVVAGGAVSTEKYDPCNIPRFVRISLTSVIWPMQGRAAGASDGVGGQVGNAGRGGVRSSALWRRRLLRPCGRHCVHGSLGEHPLHRLGNQYSLPSARLSVRVWCLAFLCVLVAFVSS